MGTRQRLKGEIMNTEAQTTYGMLVRSEEKGRGIMETILYGLLCLSVVFSILQFVHEQNQMPARLTGVSVERSPAWQSDNQEGLDESITNRSAGVGPFWPWFLAGLGTV
jgi:hypothetical protein